MSKLAQPGDFCPNPECADYGKPRIATQRNIIKFGRAHNGQHPASAIRRTYILMHSDGGRTDEAIAQFLFCSEDTIRRTRVRYLTEDLDAALEDKPRPGREPVLNAQLEAMLFR